MAPGRAGVRSSRLSGSATVMATAVAKKVQRPYQRKAKIAVIGNRRLAGPAVIIRQRTPLRPDDREGLAADHESHSRGSPARAAPTTRTKMSSSVSVPVRSSAIVPSTTSLPS